MSDEKPAGSNSVKSNKNGPRGRFKGKREKFDHKAKYGTREKKTTTMLAEIERLKEQYAEIDPSTIETFRDLPLSQKTLKGLKDGEYEKPTEIQRESIGLALQGNDILGAAKTGSGKTLAFLIPMLESLYRVRWVTDDGVGALVISPTRELAYQTFEVLKGLGKFHDFSAGLVIGGKFVKEEAERINRTNIVICTPGRLLQHMDETFNFNADNLQILVLDEADRILDMGFAQTMNAIIENLPTQRQTMLFSATQTKSVKDLARLSLKDPVYVSVHEHSKHSTPAKLEQSYIVCELQEKFNVLWSFVKNHLKTKTLVFLSSCKQVRFIHEVFRRLRPGVTVLALHGSMQQLKRMAMYDEFCRKEFCVLFATDIAARGLDFPEVNWVVQFDCPEDANTYIHRAGRTARYQDDGEALLMLTPSEEEGMLRQFQMKKIPINGIKVNSTKLWDLKPRLESLLASDVELKEFAQRAFVSYVKSVYMMKDKEVFDVSKLDTDSYALSLGLAIPPRIRFLQKEEKRKKEAGKKLKLDAEGILEMFKATAKPIAGTKASKTGKPAKQKDDESGSESEEDASEGDAGSEAENSSDEESGSGSESESDAGSSSEEDSESDDEEKEQLERSKKGEKLNFDVGDEDLDDILTMKSVNKLDDSDKEEEEIKEEVETKTQAKKKAKSLTKAKLAKLAMKKNIKMNIKMVFDDQGEVVDDKMKKPQVPLAKEEEEYEGGINIELAQKRMREEDKIDRRTERERIHKMHREKRLKEKAKKKGEKVKDEAKEECNAVLGADDEDKGNPLDFIPDPDKVYGPQQSDSEGDDNEDSDSHSEEEGPPAKKARKPTGKKQTPQRRKDESDDNGEESEEDSEGDSEPDMPMDTGLSLVDDEALALQFLQS